MAKLGDICEILDNKRVPITASDRKSGIYPYYGANGVQDYVDDYIFDDELVLLAEDGGHFGSLDQPIAYRVSGKCWVNNHAHVLKPKKAVNVDYLCYSLMFRDISNIVNGATRQKLTQADMRQIDIPLCSMKEQQTIVGILNNVFSLLSLRKQQLAKLDELVKARFVELFGDPVSNTMGWDQAQLSNVTSKIGSGATPRGGRESYQAEGITFIRSMNVHDGRFEYKDLAHITDDQAEQLDNVTVEENDVLINITGASVARTCIVPSEVLPARVNQHVAIIRCIPSRLNSTFANSMFLNDRFKGQLLDIGESGGATRQAITKQQMENLIVIVPPMELQHQFAAFVAQIDNSKSIIQQSLERLETLKAALMQKYFG